MVDSNPSRQQCQEQTQTDSLLQRDIHLENKLLKEVDKADYFRYLYSLTNSSPEEETSTDVRDFIRSCKPTTTASEPLSEPPSKSPSKERSIPPEVPTKKIPGIHRTQSAPVSSYSVVKETPLPRKTSLLRYDISTPPSQDISFDGKQSPPKPPSQERPASDRRSVLDPLILKNSNGIDNMLKKTQKRKREPELKLVPENKRIFNGVTVFYIPPDDIWKVRKQRITKLREHGAIWTTKLDLSVITHIIVDENLTYKDAMGYLKQKFGLGSLPDSIIMVKEKYPLDCFSFKMLCNPFQKMYELEGQSSSQESVAEPKEVEKNDDYQHEQTPPRDLDSDNEDQPEHEPGLQSEHTSEPLANTSNLTDEVAPREPTMDFGNIEFSKTIQTVQKTPYFLDDSDDERPTSGDNIIDSDSDLEPERKTTKKRKTKPGFNSSNFSCMKGGSRYTPNFFSCFDCCKTRHYFPSLFPPLPQTFF